MKNNSSQSTETKTPKEFVPKLVEGNVFYAGNIKCTITGFATFSGEKHYGFTCVKSSGPTQLTEYGCGWIPCFIVEQFFGYEFPQTVGGAR